MMTMLHILAIPLFLTYIVVGIVVIDDVININKRSQ